MRETLGSISHDEDVAECSPKDGQPARAPWRLALVSVMHFLEGLSARHAADAVRGRLDWKDLLGLERDDPGCDHRVLVEFRQRVVEGNEELRIVDLLLARLREGGSVTARGRQRSDATHVLAKIRSLSRVEVVGEPVRATVNVLAVAAPEWLTEQMQEGWGERDKHGVEDERLPDGTHAREASALVMGNDGRTLLNAISAPLTPAWVRDIPAVHTVRRVWVQQFFWEEGDMRWRETATLPAAGDCITSPSDPEAQSAKKRDTGWTGYNVHLTDTCDDDLPHLITHGETTPAPLSDLAARAHMYEAREHHHLFPERHLVETGSVDAEALVKSQQDSGVDLFGPTRNDSHWQARESTGLAARQCVVEWQQECAICPAGKTSRRWTPAQDRRGNPLITITFAMQDCGPCPHRQACPQTQAASPRRTLTIRPPVRSQPLHAARQREREAEFTMQSNQRAGSEGTLSQAVRSCG